MSWVRNGKREGDKPKFTVPDDLCKLCALSEEDGTKCKKNKKHTQRYVNGDGYLQLSDGECGFFESKKKER